MWKRDTNILLRSERPRRTKARWKKSAGSTRAVNQYDPLHHEASTPSAPQARHDVLAVLALAVRDLKPRRRAQPQTHRSARKHGRERRPHTPPMRSLRATDQSPETSTIYNPLTGVEVQTKNLRMRFAREYVLPLWGGVRRTIHKNSLLLFLGLIHGTIALLLLLLLLLLLFFFH